MVVNAAGAEHLVGWVDHQRNGWRAVRPGGFTVGLALGTRREAVEAADAVRVRGGRVKVRLKVTFTAERARKPEPAQHDEADPQPPRVDGKGSFILERAEPAPIGFTVDMPDRRHE